MRIPREVIYKRIQDCKALREDGLTFQQIADKLGITKGQVSYCFNKDTANASVQRWKAKPENKDYQTQRYAKLRAALFKNVECKVCGDTDAFLSFHHIDPETKLFKLTDALLHMHCYTEEEIAAEKVKCIVLCCSCHRKLHMGKLVGWEHLYQGPLQRWIINDDGKFGGIYYE